MSLRIKLGWAAAMAFCGLHATASGAAALLGRFPSSATLWSLYLEISRPFALFPQSGAFAQEINHAGLAVVFAGAGAAALAAMCVRAPALWAGFFAGGWLLSLVNFAACLYGSLAQGGGAAGAPVLAKLLLLLMLGFAFHLAIREIWRPRASRNGRRGPPGSTPA